MAISSLLYGDYLLVKKIYFANEPNEPEKMITSIKMLNSEYFDNCYQINNSKNLCEPDDIYKLNRTKLKEYQSNSVFKKNSYGLLENKQVCLFDIKNKLMVKKYIEQIEKHNVKFYTTVSTKTSDIKKSNFRSGYVANLNSNSNSYPNIMICSNPETYLELCSDFLLSKFVVLVLSIGLFIITLTIFDELREYSKSLGLITVIPEQVKTTKSNDNIEIIV